LKHVLIVCKRFDLMSRPTRARGLKHWEVGDRDCVSCVAPHAGAWIETSADLKLCPYFSVAPHAGAWIETLQQPLCR